MHVFDRILDILVGIWDFMCGGINNSIQAVRPYVSSMLFILGGLLTLIISGYIFKIQELIVFPAVIAALMFYFGWSAGNGLVNFIKKVGENLPLVGGPITASLDELQKLTRPFLMIAMSLSFQGAIMAIKGPAYFSFGTFLVILAVVVFMLIFSSYIESKTKVAGWVMFSIVAFLLVGNVLMPIQVQGIFNYVEGKSINLFTGLSKDGQREELVFIPAKSNLYRRTWQGSFEPAGKSPDAAKKAKVKGERMILIAAKGCSRSSCPMTTALMSAAKGFMYR